MANSTIYISGVPADRANFNMELTFRLKDKNKWRLLNQTNKTKFWTRFTKELRARGFGLSDVFWKNPDDNGETVAPIKASTQLIATYRRKRLYGDETTIDQASTMAWKSISGDSFGGSGVNLYIEGKAGLFSNRFQPSFSEVAILVATEAKLSDAKKAIDAVAQGAAGVLGSASGTLGSAINEAIKPLAIPIAIVILAAIIVG